MFYGENEESYRPVEKPDGRLEVQVWHTNKRVRDEITLHGSNPSYFLKYAEFKGVTPKAKYWLAKLVRNHRGAFRAGRVDFVFK